MIKKDYIIPSLAIIFIVALIIHGPIAQNQDYHVFVDARKLFGIPNFFNVITNLPFALVGLLGMQVVSSIKEKKLKHISLAICTGFLLVTIGSGYYHLRPNNNTLVYDRIPIIIIVMSFFAFIIYYSISLKKGYEALIVFNIIGVMSVIYWIMTEHKGHGDLRWYGLVQFFPIVAIPVMLWLYNTTFKYWKQIAIIFLLFGIARISEIFDKEIYDLLNQTISGHSLKHLFMAAAGYEIIVLLRYRLKVLRKTNFAKDSMQTLKMELPAAMS